jgi:hypothetical protein
MTLTIARRHALALLFLLEDVVDEWGGAYEVVLPTWVDDAWRRPAQAPEALLTLDLDQGVQREDEG